LISDFSTVYGFWVDGHFSEVDDWPGAPSYFLFRDGIWPRFEEPANANGGYYSLQVAPSRARSFWLDVAMFAVGETLFETDEGMDNVTGLSLTIRPAVATVKIWTRAPDQDEAQLPKFLRDTHEYKGVFINHPKPGDMPPPAPRPQRPSSSSSRGRRPLAPHGRGRSPVKPARERNVRRRGR
jgi:hypothetical protein